MIKLHVVATAATYAVSVLKFKIIYSLFILDSSKNLSEF